MEKKYKDTIYLAVEIIEKCVEEEKRNNYIKDMVIETLNKNGLKIKDINYYDRKYFKAIKGISISNTIDEVRFAMADEAYRREGYPRLQKKATYKGVSHFREKHERYYPKNKSFMIAEKYDLKLHDWDYDFDSFNTKADDMIFVNAESSDAALREFLMAKVEYQYKKVLKTEIERRFWEDVSYGETDEYQKFENAKEILEIADEIYIKYMENYDGDADDLYDQVDVESEMERFYSLLNSKEKKVLYYRIHRYDYVAIEIPTLDEYIKKMEWNSKHLIQDTIREVLLFWDVVLDLVRADNTKGVYTINSEILRKKGFTKQEIKELKNAIRNNDLRFGVELENGTDFHIEALYEVMSRPWKEHYEDLEVQIRPASIMYQMAEEDIRFIEGKSEKNIEILSRIMGLGDDFFD